MEKLITDTTMLNQYHKKLKKFVVFIFKVYRSEYLPSSKWKFINNLRLCFFPAFLGCGLFCTLWHIFVKMGNYDNHIELAFIIAFAISFYQGYAVYFTIIIANKTKIFDILSFFDTLVFPGAEMTNFRRKHLLENTRIALNTTKIFLIFIAIGGSVLTTYDLIVSTFHTPLIFAIPGIPQTSVFFYPVNLPYQYATFISLLEHIMTADALVMVTILYFRGEFLALAEFIEQLSDESSLRVTYDTHRVLLQKVRQLISSYWHIYFHKLLAITLYLSCMCFIFQYLDTSLIAGTFVLTAMVMQAFILCFFSQLLENSSEALAKALYRTRWYEMGLRDQRTVLLLMMIFKRPVKMDTFGFGEISIYTFVQICKAAGSYAMIFYTVFN